MFVDTAATSFRTHRPRGLRSHYSVGKYLRIFPRSTKMHILHYSVLINNKFLKYPKVPKMTQTAQTAQT